MKFTEEQEAYAQAVVDENPTRVKARAGVGKTAANVHSMEVAEEKGKNLVLFCLNTKNETETQEKLNKKGMRSSARTWHKACLGGWRTKGISFQILSKYGGTEKVSAIVGKIEEFNPFKTTDPKEKYERSCDRDEMISLLGKLKNTILHPNLEDVYNTITRFGITPEMELPQFASHALSFLKESDSQSSKLDFDDMIRFPILFDLDFVPPFDAIIADECQDNSPIQNMYLERWSKHIPIFTTGDDRQCIYGFRGADVEGFDSLAKFIPNELPMTINFRCDKSIIRHAQTMVPDIRYFEEKEEGSVTYEHQDGLEKTVPDGSAILSRFNKNIIPPAFRFLRQGRKATIIGSGDLAKSIKKLVAGLRASDEADLYSKLSKWEERQQKKAKSDTQRQLIADKVDTIEHLLSAAGSLSNFDPTIDKIFSDKEKEGVFFSTAHKSKGLQWPSVYLLDYPNFKMTKGLQPWEQVQETNIEYVAVTRPEHRLILVHPPEQKKSDE